VASDKISIADIIITWILFWVLTLASMVVFAGTILVPLWQQQCQLAAEYRATDQQIMRMEQEVNRARGQLMAICVDPQYTERIAINELNLRKPGQEAIRITPYSLIPEKELVDPEMMEAPLDFSTQDWYKLFLNQKNRRWYLILAAGLLATALVTAIAANDRRQAELGL
jgi:hypothetical protein